MSPPVVEIPLEEKMKMEGKKAPKPCCDIIVRKTKSRCQQDAGQT